MSEFKGKRVLVTGAVTGLGETIVKIFEENGAIVFAMDENQALLEKLQADSPSVNTIRVDYSDWKSLREAVDTIAPIHHLVNNATIAVTHQLLNVEKSFIDKTINTNFKSMVNVSQAVVNGLKGESGTIVNISSTLGGQPQLYSSMFCCSKAAVVMLTRCMALEYAPFKVRANCIRPSLQTSGVTGDQAVVDALIENELAKQVVKKPLDPSEVAALVLYLSSNKTSMITGEDIGIDGGLLQLKNLDSLKKSE